VNFQDKIASSIEKNNSLVCVGLDPDPQKLQNNESQLDFNKKIIDQTADLVCCFKPQIAFYAAAGIKGVGNLKETINYIHTNHQDIPVLLDAKRGDVGHTSEMYAKEIFDFFEADAVTLNPYCGLDAISPFSKRKEKGIFVICRTSNPSSAEIQDLKISDEPLYVKVAQKIIEWNRAYPNIYLEIGATWPEEIGTLRKLAPEMPFLIAGVGAQGGNLKSTLKNGLTKDKKGLIINSSRGIIYASDPQLAAKNLRDEINKYR
jgi:orotidine 5'-phosphate decarboxylase subfamily 2